MRMDITITPGERPKRLDVFLATHERQMSRARLQRLIKLGRVRVNGEVCKSSQRVRGGDRILIETPPAMPLKSNGEIQALTILHEDEAILVLNKPSGVVMHPGSGHWSDTLVNAVAHHLQDGGSQVAQRVGFVHRLDKDTSGVVLFAKTEAAHRCLSGQFAAHTIARQYLAFVHGVPATGQSVIDCGIGRDRRDPRYVSVNTVAPKVATTSYEVLQRYGEVSASLRLTPYTGRTHQLRVHMQSMGHPILGDRRYGLGHESFVAGMAIPRLMLHATLLGIRHPSTEIYQQFEAALPEDMLAIEAALNSRQLE